ncbi:MAG TPA: peptidoglycan DD-metalloendopeptidase family protein [Nitriliruptorales bacterium]|nr:peptidoglycan DD-metalloendopeptidase family protein [Nitriliruptorales bacterium]
MRPARGLAVLCTALALGSIGPAPATAHGGDQAALVEARRKIAAVEAQLSSARAEQTQAEAAVREADAQLAVLEAAVNQVAAALDRQELAVEEAQDRVAGLEAVAAAQMAAFAERAAAMYKRGVGIPFEAVMAAGSMGEALERGAYVQALSASDRAALEQVIATRTAVDAERQRLAEERDRLAHMKAEQEAVYAKVEELRRHRALQAAAAGADVVSLESQKEGLEAESRRVERLIRERQRAAALAAERAAARAAAQASSRSAGAAVGRAVSASGYAWPRCGPVTSEFGRRWGRMHTGIDIDGDTGDPIYASKGGVVIFTGWQGGYGRLTLVDHGDGVVTAYAHQSAFAVGQGSRVAQGQRIGSVGNTGNSTGPHLHFETRVNGTPVNPRRLLSSGC